MYCPFIFLSFLVLKRVSEGEDSVLTPVLEVRMIGPGFHSGRGVTLRCDVTPGSGHQDVQSPVETLAFAPAECDREYTEVR